MPTMAWTSPRQVKKVIGTYIYNGMDPSMPLDIYVPITFLTWRGRVHAIVYLCSNELFNLAWTRPCQQWHGRVHAKLKK